MFTYSNTAGGAVLSAGNICNTRARVWQLVTQTVMAEKDAGVNKLSSPAERQLVRRRQELADLRRSAARMRSRNLVTGLTIGAFVIGMCILRVGKTGS